MPIVINGSGTVTGLSVGGISNAKAVATAAMPAGSVIQVVSMTDDTHSIKTNTSYEDIPGFTLNITPTAASNKILIQASLCVSKTNNHSFLGEFQRDGTTLPGGDADQGTFIDNVWWNVRSSDYASPVFTYIYLDTVPGDWSSGAITYKIQGQTSNSGTTWAMNQSVQDSNAEYDTPTVSNLTLTEIKA